MQDLEFKRLASDDGSWDALVAQWSALCDSYGESFAEFNSGTVSLLEVVCSEHPQPKKQGTFGLVGKDGTVHAVCFLNLAIQKGFDGPVLRVLNFLLSPFYDFEDLDIEDYTGVLAAFFVNVVKCSEAVLPSQHIKIHFRSQYDSHFFAGLGPHLSGVGPLATVESKGMWLSVTKR